MRLRSAFLGLALLTASHAAAAQVANPAKHDMPASVGHAAAAELLPSPVAVAIDAPTLAALPRQPVNAFAHGKALSCEGVPLVAVLRAAQAMPADALRGAALSRYVLVTARDGYRALYSLGELDGTLGNHAVFVVDRCDGKPLDDDDGPLRLIAPADARPARWVRQVQAITVVAAP